MIPSDLIQALNNATLICDNARGHSKSSSTQAAESIPALCSFSKSMRKKSGRRLLGSPITASVQSPNPTLLSTTDRRWDSNSPSPSSSNNKTQSPLLYIRSPNSPSPRAFDNSPFSPSSSNDCGAASPRIPRRKLSGEVEQQHPPALADQSPRKPTRRTVSPLLQENRVASPTTSPTSPTSGGSPSVQQHMCPFEPGQYRRDTPHVAARQKKKSVAFRQALTVAIDFCDLSD